MTDLSLADPVVIPPDMQKPMKSFQAAGLSFTDGAWAQALQAHGINGMLYDAGLSSDPEQTYRYWLKREWRSPSESPSLPFIMLNPSTADAKVDDPTIRRCISFAKREGYGSVMVLNLYAYRATKPSEMLAAFDRGVDIVGPANDKFLENLARQRTLTGFPEVVVAWGAHRTAVARAEHVTGLLRSKGAEVMCLGKTDGGAPRHPLYVKGDSPLIPYP